MTLGTSCQETRRGRVRIQTLLARPARGQDPLLRASVSANCGQYSNSPEQFASGKTEFLCFLTQKMQMNLMLNIVVSVVSCGSPTAPAHGAVRGNTFTFGSSVSFVCHPGRFRQGDSTSRCQANKQWSVTQRTTCTGIYSSVTVFCP